MARPLKKGIEYFSFDVDMREDPDVRRLILSFGSEYARLIYIDLLSYIYRHEGIYMDASVEDLSIFADTFRHTLEDVQKVVKIGVKVGLFDANYYQELAILTSNSIIKRYELATKRRSGKNTVSLPNLPTDVVTDNNNEVTDNNNEVTESINTTKESKVKESKVKNKAPRARGSHEIKTIVENLMAGMNFNLEYQVTMAILDALDAATPPDRQISATKLMSYFDAHMERPEDTRIRSELAFTRLLRRDAQLFTEPIPEPPPEPCSNPNCENGLVFFSDEARKCPDCNPPKEKK